MRLLIKGLGLAAAVALASPAAAAGLCGGIGDHGQWIGGAEAGSDITTVSDYQQQMALVLADSTYVALFSTSAPTDVRVEAEGRGGGNPAITLYDASGAVMLTDDDSGGNGSARGEMTLQPGTYCLEMHSVSNQPMTGFVRVSRGDQEALTTGASDMGNTDLGNSQPSDQSSDMGTGDTSSSDGSSDMAAGDGSCTDATNAAALGNGPIDGQLGDGVTGSASADATPFWRFTLDQPQAVTITAKNENADPSITLYDSTGGYLADNDDFDGLNSRIDMSSPLPAGNYCIAVQALTDTTLPIDVKVARFDPAEALRASYDRGEAAPPLDGSYPVTDLGPLGARMRTDIRNTDKAEWFTIRISEPGIITIDAISTDGNGDPSLGLFDDLGRTVAKNDDNGNSLDAQIIAKVNPGLYMIAVQDLNGSGQGFTRLAMERFVPAQ
ncbi:MAG: ABC transporter substrate-binding protein [Limimaricola sp.]|uniref:ABC transporter substrate-binding protein n=1 Tax=Limimaricola sp. TaxID=2211665 RepID=UPI001D2A631A|nr:ABC transporter substrate-binding protein [Limimaricola sp.]MBI1416940.1 ABC transporter substrate-binding protein [Limimaricola sp.]